MKQIPSHAIVTEVQVVSVHCQVIKPQMVEVQATGFGRSLNIKACTVAAEIEFIKADTPGP
ncbi:MAG: hypothetical protein WB699_03365, partial [Bacteroidota bacterium]